MVRMLCVELIDRDFQVIEERCVDKDIFEEYVRSRKDDSTNNWITLIGAIFQAVANGESYSLTIVDVDGISVSAYFKYPWTSPASIFSTAYGDLNAYISLGTDSTPTSISDYKLRSKVVDKAVESISIDTANRVMSLTSTFAFTSAVTIYEIGLELDVVALVGNTYKKTRILLDRTVMSGGIAVQSGQGLRVTYRFSL